MTDYFGPVIYSHFGEQATSVPFDSQQDIYNDFFKTLDEASAVLKQNPSANGFGATTRCMVAMPQKWLKLANSLRLRFALRIVYADAGKAGTEAEKAVAGGVILANADNARRALHHQQRENLSRGSPT